MSMPGGALGGEALEPMDAWAFNAPKGDDGWGCWTKNHWFGGMILVFFFRPWWLNTIFSMVFFFNGLFTYYPLTAGWILRRTKETEAAKPMLRKQGWAKNFGVAAERKKTKNRAPGPGWDGLPQWESSRNWGWGPFFGSFFRCVQIIEDLYDLYVSIFIYIYDII